MKPGVGGVPVLEIHVYTLYSGPLCVPLCLSFPIYCGRWCRHWLLPPVQQAHSVGVLFVYAVALQPSTHLLSSPAE